MKTGSRDPVKENRIGLLGLDPRSKILLILGFIVTVSLLPPGAFLFYGILLILLYLAAYLSRTRPDFLLRRSIIALPFTLAALTLLFSVPGEILWRIPLLNADITIEGVTRFSSVVIKSWISVQAAILLIAIAPFQELMWSLQALHTPKILVSVAAFTYRYLDVLRTEASRLRRARLSRSASLPGTRSGGTMIWRAKVTGWMVGSLMIRSLERSERIYNAMLARGYQGEVKTLAKHSWDRNDAIALLAAAVIFSSLTVIAFLM